MSKMASAAHLTLLILALFSLVALGASQARFGDPGSAAGREQVDSRSFQIDPNAPYPVRAPGEFEVVAVPMELVESTATYESSARPVPGEIRAYDPPRPASRSAFVPGEPAAEPPAPRRVEQAEVQDAETVRGPRPPSLGRTFDTTNFGTNNTHTGFVFIPPDPIGAAGLNHLISVVNVTVRFHAKDGTILYDDSLQNFFAPLSPVNFTFDPKVIYDQYADRYLIVTLEKVDDGACATAPACTSRILLAVSKTSSPMGGWWMTSINGEENISGFDYWADYPGFAIDEEAVYITNNMFGFQYIGQPYGGTRLWIVNKAPFYSGGTAGVSKYNPYGGGGVATTSQPAHVFGTGLSPNVGTFLVSYSGLSNGTDEFLQVVRIDNPLGMPVFTQEFILLGNIETLSADIPDAPQKGSATRIEVNDRRALNAVWRNGSLWMVATIDPISGPGAGEATAVWWQLDTSTLGTTTITDQGRIGGEDIAPNTSTFFPSIAVNDRNEVAIGFAASASAIYAGSYYTIRAPDDPASTTRGSAVLRKGTDYYVRTFGGPRNRWGDYTGTAVDPATNCFWVYNQHAITRGLITSPPTEDGQWGTAFGEICTGFRTIVADAEAEPATEPDSR